MAKQRGIIKQEGTISDITFQKTKDGYLAKEKSQIAASKIATAPSFERTRENMAEFARAGRAGKLLRQAFRAQLQQAADGRVTSRLTRKFMRVIQSDTVNPRGQRVVSEGPFPYLENFEFNVNGKLATTLFAPYTVNLNRATGAAGFPWCARYQTSKNRVWIPVSSSYRSSDPRVKVFLSPFPHNREDSAERPPISCCSAP